MKGSADFSKNNLDFLRLVMACIVFLFHVCALTNLPAFSPFGKYLSPHFAVKSFFVISGLLIYRSYTRSSSMGSYFEKRARRICPAYFTIIILAAVALCPLSILTPAQYYLSLGFWKYLGANLLFLNFLAPTLPGVFTSNNIPAVNGALWTLKIEVAFYLFIPVLHYLSNRFGTKRTMGVMFALSCIWKYGFAYLASIDSSHSAYSLDASRNIYSQMEVQLPGQLVYFLAGILILLYFDELKHHFRSVCCVTACLFLIDHWLAGDGLDVLAISGMVFVVGFWRYFGNFSKYGDFSYGVYIVHWPILQVMIVLGLAAKLAPVVFLLLSVFFVAFAAALMWTFVESRFLATSSHYRQGSLATGGASADS
ncbi:MAG: acyltransferase [Acidobacteriaceae bacterium]|jgi:peptidoglycan/LPS O-acetylase OafA/YrhL